MEDFSRGGGLKITRSEWMHLLGTNVGTGSGEKLDPYEVMKNHQIITGYELIESFSAKLKGGKFNIGSLIIGLNGDLKDGHIAMVERPTRENQFGRFQYPEGVSLDQNPDGSRRVHSLLTWFADTVCENRLGMRG